MSFSCFYVQQPKHNNNDDEELCCPRQFLRSLFEDGGDNDDDDDENGISKHIWTCPISNTSIVYHLARNAPGHGNRVWNSSMCIAQHLLVPELRMSLLNVDCGNAALKNGRSIKLQQQQFVGVWPPTICIEFGAGAALPSLVLMKEGAGRVVITDRYVNECTFDALRQSVISTNSTTSKEEARLNEECTLEQQRAVVVAHTWGENIDELLSHIGGGSGVHNNNNNNDKDVNITATTGVSSSSSSSSNTIIKANLLIASDCIYNPTYHHALLHSVISTMDNNTGRFVVGYSLHGNVPSKQILDFFTVAQREYGLIIVNELCINYPNGQLGIGSTDIERGVVYIKVLAHGDDG